MRIRRRRICFVQIADQLLPDLSALFSGELKMQAQPQADLLCPLDGGRIRVHAHELRLLANLPANDWTDAQGCIDNGLASAEQIADLVQRHVLLSDADDDTASRSILEAEDRMQRIGWFDLTAVYHAMTRWSGMADDVATREHTPEAHSARLVKVAEKHGPPPPHFPRREDAVSRHPLELPALDTSLAKVLRARRTTRAFEREAVLPQADLAHMLYGCFGAMGTRELAPGATAVKRTSASGGGLTPIDPYPMIMRVEGLESGMYHYDMSSHSLELLKAIPEQPLRDLVMETTAGQDYFSEAQVAIVHVARFDRHHWKYRNHAKAYKALLMDSAHLSQTFYLLATELGRGAFYTAAINDTDLGQHLGLDPIQAAPVGISGLGIKGSEQDSALHFNPLPYVPRVEEG